MTKTSAAKPTAQSAKSEPNNKTQQVIQLLLSQGGATLEEMSTLANWQPHSTRSFMTGLKKKGYIIESDKVDGARRYRITSNGGA